MCKLSVISQEQLQTEVKLLLRANRKSLYVTSIGTTTDDQSSSGDEIPERDVMYSLSSYLFTYLPLNYDTPVVPEYFSK